MPKEDSKDLKKFLKPYSKEVQHLALSLREWVWELYPGSNELIYDNYNAVAFGWSASDKVKDIFCSIAAYSDYVHFGFYYGSQLTDPEKRLSGKGSQYRYIIVRDLKTFPKTYMKKILKEAWALSLSRLKDYKQVLKGLTIVKSISSKKKRPVYK